MPLTLRIAAIALLLAQLISLAQCAEPAKLRAGIAAYEITPQEYPLNMPGGFSANMAEKAHDRLFARTLVLSAGEQTVSLTVVDNLGIAPAVNHEAKEIASKKTGIPIERMLISATHTHSAPAANVTDGPAPAVAYRRVIVEGIAESIIAAHGRLSEASLGVASHPLPEEVFNRRWHLKPGKMPLNPFGRLDEVKMNPENSPEALDRPAGPTDPEFTVISVRDSRNKPLCLFANYALHYVGGTPPAQVSADYFGEFARLMPSRLRAGEEFVAMLSNGASGDINNIPFGSSRPPREPFEQIRLVAAKAADTAYLAERKIASHSSQVKLNMLERTVKLRLRRPTQEQVTEARTVLAVTDPRKIERQPRLAQHYARKVVQAAERSEEELAATLQAIAIDDFIIFAIPFETFVEIGLELRERSGFARSMTIGLANGRHGYLPTPRQHRLGGYETWLGTNEVSEETSDMIVKELLEMARELKK